MARRRWRLMETAFPVRLRFGNFSANVTLTTANPNDVIILDIADERTDGRLGIRYGGPHLA